uniref:hypothetical protein RF2 n=1 Tax=Tetraselmis marina TaxID=41888 RepID=UPI0021ACA987|nr:hypothetical protein RF2 [Tetraselmis marina]UUA64565.1 hypothetical protein RF2 [Tetraselmis marina]
MTNKIKKNVFPASVDIWILKFHILNSLIQVHLKHSFLVLFRVNAFTLGISLVSLTYYISFFESDVRSKKFANFVQKNLPGVYLTATPISWQTFQKTGFLPNFPLLETSDSIKEKWSSRHILENIFLNNVMNSIDYWGTHLQLKFTSKWTSYKRQYFFGLKISSIKQKSLKPKTNYIFVARDNITSPYYQCFLNSNSVQEKFYQLDEFPLHLQQTRQILSVNELDVKVQFLNQLPKINKRISTNTSLTQKIYFQKYGHNEVFFAGLQNMNTNASLAKQAGSHLINNVKLNDTYVKWKNIQILTNNFFYKKNYFSLIQNTQFSIEHVIFYKLFKQTSFSNIASSQIIFFLNQIDSKRGITTNLDSQTKLLTTREMSGFFYPDMNTNQVMGLYQKLKYFTKLPQVLAFKKHNTFSQINIRLGSHFIFPVYHKEGQTVSPKLKFKYSPIKLNANDGTLCYNGPGVSIGLKKLNKLTYNVNAVEIQLRSQLALNNPRQSNLFRSFLKEPVNGKIVVTAISPTVERVNCRFSEAKTRQYYQNFLQIKELSSEREPINHHIDFKSEYIVPHISNPKNELNKLTSTVLIKTRLIQSFPVRQVSFVTSLCPYTLFDNLDYQNPISSLRNRFSSNFSKNLKLEFHEKIQQQSSLPIHITRITFENIGYFKKFQPYSDPNASLTTLANSQKFDGLNKGQRYEPIHAQSWLTVNKYLLALFVFYILRQLTKEYGRELVAYLIDLISSLGILDESVKEELTGDSSSSGYRLIMNSQKRFKDIAGIEHIFSALSEIVWFLRNSGRAFNVSNVLSKGILLTGPPGTGKTLLVQTIAGEAQVPVLVQSASALNSVDGYGAQRLQNLFEKAKELVPCVIFFDEIDSIGERRMHIIDDTTQLSKLINIISSNGRAPHSTSDSVIPFNLSSSTFSKTQKLNDNETNKNSTSSEQLGLLMQLLIELDGLQSARQVVIIGATNRPNVLDPALTRPGRLDTVFQLRLPDKEKRIEICQLYSKILGSESDITWNYIGNKTLGLSGADLAAIINQSAIQGILQKTKHTRKTLDQAIDKITGDSTLTNAPSFDESKEKLSHMQSLNLARSAYYYSGLAISHLLLPDLKTAMSCSLFPIDQNPRYVKMLNKFLQSKLSQTPKKKLEAQLVSIYAGKILEILYLGQNMGDLNINLAQSDLGKKELIKGTNLIYFFLNHWFLYSENQMYDQLIYSSENKNRDEILDSNAFLFLKELLELNTLNSIESEKARYHNFQLWTTKSWWQSQITAENASFSTIYADWYRIYVTNPDETETNDEWISPDRYFHTNETYLLTRTISFNNFYKLRRDFVYQSILEKVSLNAFNMFNKIPEFNDFFVMNLIQKDQLRQYEMDAIYSQFIN